MRLPSRLSPVLAVLLPVAGPAFAHGGHVGELAGHSHWLGWAAIGGAALLAALVRDIRNRRKGGKRRKAAKPEATEAEGAKS